MPQRYTVRQLAEASDTSLPSIKFYLRERLLPAGDPGAAGRAYYDHEHLERLRLIRVLRDVSKLPIDTIRAVLAALDAGKKPVDVVALAMDALHAPARVEASREHAQAVSELQALLRQLGVRVRPRAGALHDLAAALVSLRRAWKPELPTSALLPYAQIARQLARREVAANARALHGDPRQLLQVVVHGTVLFEPILLAFRRIMHEHFARSASRSPARSA